MLKNKKINIEYVDISFLKPATYNPRTWDKAAVAKLTESIKRFGLVDPLIVKKVKLNPRSGNKNEPLDGWGDRFAIWESRPDKEEDTFEKQWMDIDYIIKRTLYEIKYTGYFGKSIPIFTTNWVFGHALLFGSKIGKITGDDVFVEPLSLEKNSYPALKFDLENYYWNYLQEITARAVKCSENKYFVQPAYGTYSGDTLGILIGSVKLLTYIKDNPQWVKDSLTKIADAIIKLYEKLFQIVSSNGPDGHVNYIGCWSGERNIAVDCDIGSMISEETYKDIFLPSIMKIMNIVKYRIYHLDGTKQLRLLDILLDIKEIHAIQWAPGVEKKQLCSGCL